MKCYKWRVKKTGDVVLRERPVEDQHLVTATPGSVSFQSPGFNNNNQHYMNSMFCLYNITVRNCDNHNCDSITVHSMSGDHRLFFTNTTVEDYLFLDYEGVEVSRTLYGREVSSYFSNVHTSSFMAILWSDAAGYTSAGAFDLVAVCNECNAVDGRE